MRRVGDFAERLDKATGGTAEHVAIAAELERAAIEAALYDDLNAPEAMAALFEFIRDGRTPSWTRAEAMRSGLKAARRRSRW